MKKILCFTSIISLAACSSSKYTAGFHKSNVEVGYHLTNSQSENSIQSESQTKQFVASTSFRPELLPQASEKEAKNTFVNMTKVRQKTVRQQLRKQIKSIIKSQKKEMSVTSTQASGMDHDLKLAAIFGAVGIVVLLLGSTTQVFTIIGGIALIIGVVFFVKWLLRQ